MQEAGHRLASFLFLYQMSATFKKIERLHHKKDIEAIFKSKNSFLEYPFKVVYLEKEADEKQSGIKVLISIPKKKFKKAVDRNLLKRRCKEAYRLNKAFTVNLLKKKNKELHIAFIYIATNEVDFNTISSKIILILERFNKLYE